MEHRDIDYCPVCHDYVDVAYNGENWICLTCGADLGEEAPIMEIN